MSATLPATHLLRQFLLFALIVVFLLLIVRAGYALWQFPAVEEAGSPLRLFLTGLRFDVSIVAGVCLVPLVLGSLLGMFDATRGVAKALVVTVLVLALIVILGTELVTPHLLGTEGVRPDASTFADPAGLAATLVSVAVAHPLPSALGATLLVLIVIAYVARMETGRFLRFRLSRPSALALALLGGVACALLARSTLDPRAPALSIADADVGGPPIVAEIATNSAWTTLHPLLAPLFAPLP